MYYIIKENKVFGLEIYKVGDIVFLNDDRVKKAREYGAIDLLPPNQPQVATEKPQEEPQRTQEAKEIVIEDKQPNINRFGKNIFESQKDLMLFLNLCDAKEILDEMKLNFWLNNGTLLGYYREGKFIDNDVDIDLGLFDFKEGIIDKFKEYGFELYKEYGDKKTGLQYSFIRNGYKLDLFFFKKKRDAYYQFVWDKEKHSYKFPKFGLRKTSFYGLEFNIPDNVEEVLVAQYGDWKKPKSDWDYIGDPKNICQI